MPKYTLKQGNCLDLLKELPENSIDTVITDPPYHLTSLPKGESNKVKTISGPGICGNFWDGGSIAFQTETWQAVHRVMKPGAIMLVFGASRTAHRLISKIEDSSFIIHDAIVWHYSSGVPKGQNIGKLLAKKANTEEAYEEAKIWMSHATCIKPSYEIISVAMKPLDGTYVHNAQKWGIGGFNIDNCKIGNDIVSTHSRGANEGGNFGNDRFVAFAVDDDSCKPRQGRYPANVLFQHSEDCTDKQCTNDCPIKILDEQSGILKSGKASAAGHQRSPSKMVGIYGGGKGLWQNTEKTDAGTLYGDSGGASRFFYCAKPAKKEKNEGCEHLLWKAETGVFTPIIQEEYDALPTNKKATGNIHATVKGQKLLEYLCKLTSSPTDGTILDPFAGSGSIGVASLMSGRNFIGFDIEPNACLIAECRLKHTLEKLATSKHL